MTHRICDSWTMMLHNSITWLLLSVILGLTASTTLCKQIQVCGNNSSLSVPFHELPSATPNVAAYDINLCPANSVLTGTLAFLNKDSVSLTGKTNSTLTCRGQGAGFSFKNVARIKLHNVAIKSCGSMHSYYTANFSSSIFIENSSNISLQNTALLNSQGSGMVVLNSYARIEIVNCTIKKGSIKTEELCGGGGLFIELACFNKLCPRFSTDLTVTNTHFEDNHGGYSNATNIGCFNLNNGGGMSLLFKGNTNKNKVSIRNCTFKYNSVTRWGGGLFITITKWSKENNIFIENVTFYRNRCNKQGGGGADIGFLTKLATSSPRNNTVKFINTMFQENIAKFGGGTLVHSTTADITEFESNRVIFINCHWVGNVARYSSAVYLNLNFPGTYNSASYLPIITFASCTLKGNRVSNHIKSTERYTNQNSYHTFKRGKGCFSSIGYKVVFSSSMLFVSNSGSALYLASSSVEVSSGSSVSFIGNTGHYGGAICLLGTSILHLQRNIALNFTGNTAIIKGGAIYQEHVDTLEYISLRKCFIYYNGPGSNNSNITCWFRNNYVTSNIESLIHGNSIYMHSLGSCKSIIQFGTAINRTDCIKYSGPIADFVFENSTKNEISTAGTKFKVNLDIIDYFPIIPGKVMELPIEVNDDFNRNVLRVYQALLKTDPQNKHDMLIDPKYVHLYYNQILLHGTPGDKGNVTFSLSSIGDIEVILPFELVDCPPGFVIESKNGLGSCVCSIGVDYIGISRCNQSSFRAVLKRGYWLGYRPANFGTKKEIILSQSCPRSFCNKNGTYYLPNTSSVHKLDSVICGEERTGVLCGECRGNYSAFYHSQDFKCAHSKHCNLGWLFYIASEMIPVTLFFLIVLIWDIQLTSGSIQGFIFYSQLFDTLLISANGQIALEAGTDNALIVLKFFLGIFNLNFFSHDHLSFCLWENASSLDMLTFKYVTIIYSFSLVFLTIFVLNFCKLASLENCLSKFRGKKKNFSSSIIHGLSGFLVVCYSQCTKISLLILTPATIYNTKAISIVTVAFYDGKLNYFSGRHLLYTIPALMFVAIIGILPPILLVVYPLCYKVLSFLRLEESKFAEILCKVVPLERLKPFFDSFQSSFRDNCRYFSGLYFIYRFSTLVTFATIQNGSLYYLAVEVQFVLMLFAHAWVQPYTAPWHNKLDAFLFTTLITVNAITLFRYNHTSEVIDSKTFLRYIENIQVTIAYLPLLYLFAYLARNLMLKCRRYYHSLCCKQKKEVDATVSDSLTLSLLDRSTSDMEETTFS